MADIARSWVVLLAEGADAPPHLPGADRGTLEAVTAAYLARMREHRDVDQRLLELWEAVNAVARMAEGVRRDVLVSVWTRFQDAVRLHAAAN
jgi:hypothetical protein